MAGGRNQPVYLSLSAFFQQALNDELNSHLDYYEEYIDIARFPSVDQMWATRDYLRDKYRGLHPDVVVAHSETAIEFVERYGSELFPGVPVVLNGLPPRGLTHATGFTYDLDWKGTLDLALTLQPDTKQVFVIGGASDHDQWYMDRVRAEFGPFERRVTFTYLTGLRVADLQQVVATLPPASIVYYVGFTEDGAGVRLPTMTAALEKVTAAANAPIYGWLELGFGHGMVGGRVQSMAAMARAAAKITARIIRGEAPEAIPVTKIDVYSNQLDWRQLQRWGISEKRAPAGTTILFREPTAWERYQRYIVGSIALVLLQSLLIGGLLVQQRRRRRVEAALRESEANFRVMADTAPVMIWRSGANKQCDFFNQPWLTFTGRTLDQELGDGWADGVHPDDVADCLSAYRAAFDRREPFRMEYRLRRADGEFRWVLDIGVPRFEADSRFAGYIGSCLDITDRKQSEQAMAQSREALQNSNQQIWDMAGRLIRAQEAERTRIARDLHDDISQQLAGFSIALSSTKRKLHADKGSRPNAEIEQALTSLQEATIALTEDIRHFSHDLHPSVLRHAGLMPALKAFCGEFERQHSIAVVFDSEPEFGEIDADSALCLYRVTQEALHNVAKHAAAHRVTVELARTPHGVALTIADDGRGFDVREPRTSESGLGLLSIEERVRLAHGQFHITTQPECGTRLRIELPCTASTRSAAASVAVTADF
jgi:PAS domain S-box-containing protein